MFSAGFIYSMSIQDTMQYEKYNFFSDSATGWTPSGYNNHNQTFPAK